MRQLCLIALALVSSIAFAQTYRWIDPATGRTMITDTPPPGNAKKVARSKNGTPEEDAQLPFATRKAAENFPVILFTAPECAAECKQARDFLNKRGIPFSEKMVQKPEEFEELKSLVGGNFVPSLKVGKQGIKGFEEGSYNNVLDLAGYPPSAPLGSKPSGGLAK